MVTCVTLGRGMSWPGRIERFHIARAALAPRGGALFRRSDPLDGGAVESLGPAIQQRALRHHF